MEIYIQEQRDNMKNVLLDLVTTNQRPLEVKTQTDNVEEKKDVLSEILRLLRNSHSSEILESVETKLKVIANSIQTPTSNKSRISQQMAHFSTKEEE